MPSTARESHESATSNFAFLQPDWPDLLAEARRAEAAAHADPRTACFYARRTLELAVAWLYQAEGAGMAACACRTRRICRHTCSSPAFSNWWAGGARQDGCDSPPGQPGGAPRPPGATARCPGNALRELFHVAFWLAQHYARRVGDRPAAGCSFAPICCHALPLSTLPKNKPPAVPPRPPRKRRWRNSPGPGERDAALREAAARNAELDAELARYRAEIAAAKAANAAQPATAHDYNEAATRDLFIDLLLKEAGWALDQKPATVNLKCRGHAQRQAVRGFCGLCAVGGDPWPWWKPAHPPQCPEASSRPACMPTAWKKHGHRP